MQDRPDGVRDEEVAQTLERHWGLTPTEVTYAPVGFGSYHWIASGSDTKWFLTVDDLDARGQQAGGARASAASNLSGALTTATALQEAGHEFVVAPIRSQSGAVLENINDRFVLAVYPHVDGQTGSFGPFATRQERFAVVDRLAALHGDTSVDQRTVRVDDCAVPCRDGLTKALGSLAAPWKSGPYAEPTRTLLVERGAELSLALRHFDAAVDSVGEINAPRVITHGEPHRGNVIFTTQGAALIDWDTALLAAPERDLWSLIEEDPAVVNYYEATTGRALNTETLRLYRDWWDLCEVSLFVNQFRQAHTDSPDAQTAWRSLTRHMNAVGQ